MTDVRHLVVGPSRHGVVQHAGQLATACAHTELRVARPDDVHAADLHGARVVHVPFTDRLFGTTIEDAVEAMTRLAGQVAGSGASLSLTLHDVPHDDSPLQRRRLRGYAEVIALARGVVVNSEVELAVVAPLAQHVRSLRVIRLPVLDVPACDPPVGRPSQRPTVGVLGFVYPDRGYDDVLSALPHGAELLAVGEPSAGHASLVRYYADRAAALGVGFRVTGFVADADLPGVLASVDVPVAPNRRVTASASINTWAAHRRRVLVPDSPYTQELRRLRPHTIDVYDPAVPDDLSRAIGSALTDRASTMLAGPPPGPSVRDCAAQYREHFATCVPARAVAVGRERYVVPGNRWDLLDGLGGRSAPISVVIPYYDAQDDLDRLLAGLGEQTHRGFEVVVADDGSPQPPRLDAADGLTVRTVRQDDRGFRAAAARNLGAAAADGEILAFLDADMVPEPGYLAALSRLPATAPDCLTVGRRRHAALQGWTPSQVRGWLAGGAAPRTLTEPEWLRAEYERTGDLLHGVDSRSYRYVISAVLAVHRELFDEIGGFDESFTRYGGEDWEFTHRAYVAGAVLAHVPAAVAWHDGPDWAERSDAATRQRDKELETEQLARVLPDPVARAGRSHPDRPAIVVRLPAALGIDDTRCTVASAGAADCAFWHPDPAVVDRLRLPGVFAGPPTAPALASATTVAEVADVADLGALPEWSAAADRVGVVHAGSVTVHSQRLLNRTRRWQRHTEVELAPRLLGRHDLPGR